MKTPLSLALSAKQKADKLTLTDLADAIDVSAPSATAALKGKSFPNATTAPKFAKFLGITVEELQAMKKGKPTPAAKTKPVSKSAAKAKRTSKKGKTAKAKPSKPAKARSPLARRPSLVASPWTSPPPRSTRCVSPGSTPSTWQT